MFTFKETTMVVGAILAFSQVSVASEIRVDPALISVGIPLYLENCSVCHGIDGDGKGPLASGFSPQPRDFSRGSFKFRSTNVGEMASQADLMKTIKNGISGSYGQSMPAFDFFSDPELRALTEVIRYVAGIEEYGASIPVAPRPKRVDLAKGQTLYQELRCAGCHGDSGNGQGELAEGLMDPDDYPIKPADFRTGLFKGGNDPEDIWMRIYAGLDGTPMPAFGRNTSHADIWAVTEYIMTFSKQE